MTPLIAEVRSKLSNLEREAELDRQRAEAERRRRRQRSAAAAGGDAKSKGSSGRSTPYEDRQTVHDLLVNINAEINEIHAL